MEEKEKIFKIAKSKAKKQVNYKFQLTEKQCQTESFGPGRPRVQRKCTGRSNAARKHGSSH